MESRRHDTRADAQSVASSRQLRTGTSGLAMKAPTPPEMAAITGNASQSGRSDLLILTRFKLLGGSIRKSALPDLAPVRNPSGLVKNPSGSAFMSLASSGCFSFLLSVFGP